MALAVFSCLLPCSHSRLSVFGGKHKLSNLDHFWFCGLLGVERSCLAWKKTVLQGVNNLNLVSTLLPLIAAMAPVRLRKQIA